MLARLHVWASLAPAAQVQLPAGLQAQGWGSAAAAGLLLASLQACCHSPCQQCLPAWPASHALGLQQCCSMGHLSCPGMIWSRVSINSPNPDHRCMQAASVRSATNHPSIYSQPVHTWLCLRGLALACGRLFGLPSAALLRGSDQCLAAAIQQGAHRLHPCALAEVCQDACGLQPLLLHPGTHASCLGLSRRRAH